MTERGWDWFEPADEMPFRDGIDHWQACFASKAGESVMAELKAQIVNSALGPEASNAAIWMREGQRALVLHMVRLANPRDENKEVGDD